MIFLQNENFNGLLNIETNLNLNEKKYCHNNGRLFKRI